jgi:phage tail tape-measure protein
MRWPRLTLSPSLTLSRAPYWIRCTARSLPSANRRPRAAVAAHRDRDRLPNSHHIAVADLHRALEVRLDEGLLGDLRRAADVEGAHGELGARLADRLGGDDADRLAQIDRRAARQIAPVAGCADAVRVSQVSTERIFTSCSCAASISSTWRSSIMVPAGTMVSPSPDRPRPRPRCGRARAGRARR